MIDEAFYKGFEKRAFFGTSKRLGARVYSEIQKQNMRDKGMIGSLVSAIGKKILGKRNMYKAERLVNKPILEIDEGMGHLADKVMQKMPFGKNLFKHTEEIREGKDIVRKIQRASILAPVSKVTEVAKPIVFGLAVTKTLDDLRKKKNELQSEEISRRENAPATR